MRVDLHARVLARDGEEVGSVQRAVVDPRRNEITHFVVSIGGLLGREVLVPAEELERARPDGDAVRLALGRDQVERLPDFEPAAYATPPPGWLFPGDYSFGPYGGFFWPVAAAPPPDPAQTTPRRQAEPTIARGDVVLDRDGEDVGVVDDVRIDAGTGELLGVVLRVGGAIRTLLGGGDTVSVGIDAVQRVEEAAVHLRLSKEDVERMAA